jgi:glucose-1-phosphate adenylyltransferase
MKGMHGIIFSYEKKTGLRELIEHRVHGSIPFAGDYRVVDFMLSNMVNAGVTDVGVIMHGKCQSLLDHLGTGKSWDLSRRTGGLTLLPAFAYAENRDSVGQFRGKMEALGCVRDYLQHIRQDHVVLCDSDLVINLPLQEVLKAHIAADADITAVCTSALGDGSDTYFKVDENGRVRDTIYNINTPEGYRCLNVFVMSKALLLDLVEDCMAHNQFSFRRYVLQERGVMLHVNTYLWDGYAARINAIDTYFQRSMELLNPEIRSQLFCPERPIYGKENDAPSSYIDPAGECVNAMIADGCDIRGTVRNCVLFRGVQIEPGAVVENCVLFKGTVVKKGASVRNVITDKYVTIGENVTLVGAGEYPLVIARGADV